MYNKEKFAIDIVTLKSNLDKYGTKFTFNEFKKINEFLKIGP